jgi:CRP-like cAMP-binding protein
MDKTYLIKQLSDLARSLNLDISEEVIGKAVGFSQFKVYSKGEMPAREGDEAKCAGIVLSGIVRSFYIDKDGNDITQFFAREGSLCIDSGLLGFTEMKAMWEALEDTTVMLFDVKDMKELILGDEHLKTLWIGILESGMRYKVYRESAFLVENATERYLSFRKHYPKLSERVPLRYIATYLGITPESLSRIRSSMKEELK